jgi:hypothetical protein
MACDLMAGEKGQLIISRQTLFRYKENVLHHGEVRPPDPET